MKVEGNIPEVLSLSFYLDDEWWFFCYRWLQSLTRLTCMNIAVISSLWKRRFCINFYHGSYVDGVGPRPLAVAMACGPALSCIYLGWDLRPGQPRVQTCHSVTKLRNLFATSCPNIVHSWSCSEIYEIDDIHHVLLWVNVYYLLYACVQITCAFEIHCVKNSGN